MPLYQKFMKEVLSKKKLTGVGSVPVDEKLCTIVPERKILVTQRDMGSVEIPCTIKDRSFKRVLVDSGSSVSLILLSIFKKLGIEKISRSGTKLKFVDHTIKQSYGITLDVLI